MKRLLQVLAAAGLILTLLPSLLYFGGLIDHGSVFTLMTCGTVLWFISAIPARSRTQRTSPRPEES
jgi:hypothetical protein